MHGMTPLYLFLAQMSGTYQPPPLRTPSGKVSLPLSLSLSPPPPPSLSPLPLPGSLSVSLSRFISVHPQSSSCLVICSHFLLPSPFSSSRAERFPERSLGFPGKIPPLLLLSGPLQDGPGRIRRRRGLRRSRRRDQASTETLLARRRTALVRCSPP